MQARMRALKKTPEPDGKYWQRLSYGFLSESKEQRAEMMKAQREFSETTRAIFGDDGSSFWSGSSRYAFVPAVKREQLSRIEQDYNEMQMEIYADSPISSCPPIATK